MPEICKKLSGTVRKPQVCFAPSVPQAFHALEMLKANSKQLPQKQPLVY
jgi:hypothetical protein